MKKVMIDQNKQQSKKLNGNYKFIAEEQKIGNET